MSDIAERLRQHIGLDQLDEDDQVALVPRWEVEEAAAEIERLRIELRERMSQDILDDALEKWKKEIERLREVLEFVLEAARWHFDGNADPLNESPEDMTAHINGLIVKRAREALGERDEQPC